MTRHHTVLGFTQINEFFVKNGPKWRTEVFSFKAQDVVIVCDGEQIISSSRRTGGANQSDTWKLVQSIYDMAKAAEKTMKIQNIRLIEKRGGQSGDVNNE